MTYRYYLWPSVEGTHARQNKEKQVFLLLCPRLIVPLQPNRRENVWLNKSIIVC